MFVKKIANAKGEILYFLVVVLCAIVASVALAVLKYPIGAVLVFSLAFSIALVPSIITRPLLGPLLIGFFLPFERVPTLEIAGATLKINHVLILISLLACLIALFAGKIKIPKDPIRFFVILFLLSLTVSLPLAINFSRAVQVYFFMVLMGALYFIVTFSIKTKDDLRRVISAVLWGALISGVFALLQFAGDAIGLPNEITLLKEGYDKSTFGFARVQAFSQEPLYFANYLFIPLLIIFVLNLKGLIGGVFNKALSYFLLVALLIDFILAVSRGAYMGAGIVLLALIIFQAKSIINFKVVSVSLAIIFFVFIGAYFALLKGESRAIDEFISHVAVEDREKGESVVMRLSSSAQAYDIFLDHPIAGVGLGNFGPIVQGDPDEPPEEDGWAIVNNEYLELLAEGGLIAFVSFVVLLTIIFYRSTVAYLRSKDSFIKAISFALAMSFIGILVQYATFSTLYIIHVWFLIGLIAVTTNLALKGADE